MAHALPKRALFALALSPSTVAVAQTPNGNDIIVIAEPRQPQLDALDPAAAPLPAPDAAAAAARLPGGAMVGNGALSGQVQQRGLFGERLRLTINGQRFAGGGPNAMDPAFHYAPSLLVQRIEAARGAAPVSAGPALGGAIDARLKSVPFAQYSTEAPHLDMSVQGRSADRGWAVGGIAGGATDRVRFGVLASRERGGDLHIGGGGRALGTRYDRALIGAEAGWRAPGGELSVEWRHQHTGPTGNPAFALDIVYFRADTAQARGRVELAPGTSLEAALGTGLVEHRMDNQTVRAAPANPAGLRRTDTVANTVSGRVVLSRTTNGATVRLGGDGEVVDRGIVIGNPSAPAFRIESLVGSVMAQAGAFVEAEVPLGGVTLEIGGRVDRHAADAGAPRLGTVPAGVRALADHFAAADRSWRATTVDAVARLWGSGRIAPRLTLARRTRVPTPVERFSWLPTEASGGLADGNIYVGDPGLRPEVSWLAEAGVDIRIGGLTLKPSVHARRVDGFIQGVPVDATPGVADSVIEQVAAMSGDPTPLRFANVDASIVGADVAFEGNLRRGWSIEGVASVARGRRRDVQDALYRIAPARLWSRLAWDTARGGAGVDVTIAAPQRSVARANDERARAGYVVLGLSGSLKLTRNLRLLGGIENLFDRRYADHLSGVNRIAGSAVAVGERLPGAGRGVWLRLSASGI